MGTRLFLAAACLIALVLVAVWALRPAPVASMARTAPVEAGVRRVDLYHYWDDAFPRMRDRVGREAGDIAIPGGLVRLVISPVVHESFKVNAPAMLAAGGGNELFSWWAGWRTRDLDQRGLIAPIDAWWKTAGADTRFAPELVDLACTYRGRRCLLPLVQSYIGFFYDVEVFRAAGIAPPATWEDLLAACRKLRARGSNPVALGTSARWPAQFWFDYLLLRSAGPDYRQRLLDGQAAWTDPEVRHAFALWRQLIDAGAFNPNPNGSDWLDAAKQMHTRGAAMTLMGTWAMDPLIGLGWKAGTDFAWFPFPAIATGVPTTTLTVVDGLVLGAGAGEARAVGAVLDRLASPEVQAGLAKASGSFAPHLGVDPGTYDPLRRDIRASVSGRLEFPYDLATPPEAERIGLEIMCRFLDRPDDVDAILAEAQRRIAEVFARRGQAKP